MLEKEDRIDSSGAARFWHNMDKSAAGGDDSGDVDNPAGGEGGELDGYDDPDVKIILLGDSAVGKSKLIERYLMNDYNPRQLSTYALTIFRKGIRLDGDAKDTLVGKYFLLLLGCSVCG